MTTKKKDLSAFSKTSLPSAKGMKVGIVVSEWNPEVTEALFDGAYSTLIKSGCRQSHITRVNVPGSFELPTGANMLCRQKKFHAVICLGCVIQGETRHFEFICNAVAQGLVSVSLKHEMPVIFGVLTTDTMQQAIDRAGLAFGKPSATEGGKHGNKGVEAAVSAIKMIAQFRTKG